MNSKFRINGKTMENIRRFLAFNTLKCAKCVQNFVVKWHLRSPQQNKRVKWHSFWKFLSQPNLLLMKAPWMSFHYEFLHAAGALEHLWWKKQFFLQFYRIQNIKRQRCSSSLIIIASRCSKHMHIIFIKIIMLQQWNATH